MRKLVILILIFLTSCLESTKTLPSSTGSFSEVVFVVDDALWKELHDEFSEAEIVEIGYWAGFTSGGQRWIHTLHCKQGELAAHIEGREKNK